MAHKKAAGSAKNLRDSQPKFRGVKIFGGQSAKAGNIIIRQCGNKYESGKNTYMGTDFSIHAKIDGIVKFTKINKSRFDGRKYLKTVVNVVPATEVKSVSSTQKAVSTLKVAKAPKEVSVPKTEKKAPATKKVSTKKPTVAKKPATKKTVAKK